MEEISRGIFWENFSPFFTFFFLFFFPPRRCLEFIRRREGETGIEKI